MANWGLDFGRIYLNQSVVFSELTNIAKTMTSKKQFKHFLCYLVFQIKKKWHAEVKTYFITWIEVCHIIISTDCDIKRETRKRLKSTQQSDRSAIPSPFLVWNNQLTTRMTEVSYFFSGGKCCGPRLKVIQFETCDINNKSNEKFFRCKSLSKLESKDLYLKSSNINMLSPKYVWNSLSVEPCAVLSLTNSQQKFKGRFSPDPWTT